MAENLLIGEWALQAYILGRGRIYRTFSQSRFGPSCMALEVTEFESIYPSGAEAWLDYVHTGIHATASNGHEADGAVPIAADAQCAAAIWVKTGLPMVEFRVTTWDIRGTLYGQRHPLHEDAQMVGDWQKLEYEFVTPSDAVWISTSVQVYGYHPRHEARHHLVEVGVPVYLDNPVLVYGTIEDLPPDPFWTRSKMLVAIGAGGLAGLGAVIVKTKR